MYKYIYRKGNSMGRHKFKPGYTLLNDLLVRYDQMMNKIVPVDAETGCRYQLYGGTHNQGYMMVTALAIDPTGVREDPNGNKIKSIMTTGHRVLARAKFNCGLTPAQKVYHTCGNMNCLNSDHLAIGDYDDIEDVFKALGKQRGPKSPFVRKVKLQNRAYKYSIEQYLYARYHTQEETAKELAIDFSEAGRIKHYVTSNNRYRWLDEYDAKITANPKKIIDITKK
jgi:hypothetical protein